MCWLMKTCVPTDQRDGVFQVRADGQNNFGASEFESCGVQM